MDPFTAPPPPAKKPQLGISMELNALREVLEVRIPKSLSGRYIEAFDRNYCDTCDVIAYLSQDELRELGVAVGHRRMIQLAAAAIAGVNVVAPSLVQKAIGGVDEPAIYNPLLTILKGRSLSPRRPPTDIRYEDEGHQRSPSAVNFFGVKYVSEAKITRGASSSDESEKGTDKGKNLPDDNSQKLKLTNGSLAEVPVLRSSLRSARKSARNFFEEEKTSNGSSNPKYSPAGSFRVSAAAPRLRHSGSAFADEIRQVESESAGGGAKGKFIAFAEEKESNSSTTQLQTFSGAEVEWIALWGQRPSLSQFLHEMHDIRMYHEFPPNFDRLFFDNKPMPFLEASPDGSKIGLLLRIPDLSDEDGTSIATITNRVCLMVNRSTGVIVSYHSCEEDPLGGFFEEWEDGRHSSSGVERITETMIRRVLRTYNKGVTELRELFDTLENRSMESTMDDT